MARPLAVVLVLERQPEVGDAGCARSVEQDVGGLDVAMDQAAGVCVVEGLGDCRHQLGRIAECEPSLPHSLGQVAPLDVLRHDVTEPVVGPADVIDRDDVRVVEPGECAGLGKVFLDVLRPGHSPGVGHLHGDGAVELLVTGEVNPPESALAELPDDPIAADRRGIALRAWRSRARALVSSTRWSPQRRLSRPHAALARSTRANRPSFRSRVSTRGSGPGRSSRPSGAQGD